MTAREMVAEEEEGAAEEEEGAEEGVAEEVAKGTMVIEDHQVTPTNPINLKHPTQLALVKVQQPHNLLVVQTLKSIVI